MGEIKVNSIKGVGASTAAITVNNTDGTCTANLTNKPNRNLIINGAMLVAQRGTSSTSDGYATVDRFNTEDGGTDENGTREQVDVAAGTTPYTEGFRKALKFTNGNQTSTDGGDYIDIWQVIEAQNIANSGWNYTSSSSYITLSFWVKSSVAKTFLGYIRTQDGTNYNYPYSTGAISANTWTKVTKTIPGNSNLVFNNDNGAGLTVELWPYIGTSYTDSSVSLNAWKTYAGGQRTPVDTGTNFWTTDNATIEITGVQLEVSDHATDFEHRSFAVEKRLCQRYYEQYDHNDTYWLCSGVYNASTEAIFPFDYQAEKRAAPTITMQDSVNTILMRPNTSNAQGGTLSALNIKTRKCAFKSTSNPSSSSGGYATTMSIYNSGSGSTVLSIDAEL